MSRPKPSTPQKDRPQPESFEERVNTLFDELALAVRWQRPSILLAVYRSELICLDGQLQLADRLSGLGQAVVILRVTPDRFDLPLWLSQHPGREKTVFFVPGLKLAEEQNKYHAYRALNIRRELLVEHSIRVVFWLTEGEAADLPQQSPDFWAFRHRVIEFFDSPAPERVATLADRLTGGPDFQLGSSSETLQAFKKAIRRSPENANLRRSLADIYLQLGRTREALRALNKAARLAPANVNMWARLGEVYRDVGRLPEARKAYKTAIRLEPENEGIKSSLAACYQRPRRTDG